MSLSVGSKIQSIYKSCRIKTYKVFMNIAELKHDQNIIYVALLFIKCLRTPLNLFVYIHGILYETNMKFRVQIV